MFHRYMGYVSHIYLGRSPEITQLVKVSPLHLSIASFFLMEADWPGHSDRQEEAARFFGILSRPAAFQG